MDGAGASRRWRFVDPFIEDECESPSTDDEGHAARGGNARLGTATSMSATTRKRAFNRSGPPQSESFFAQTSTPQKGELKVKEH